MLPSERQTAQVSSLSLTQKQWRFKLAGTCIQLTFLHALCLGQDLPHKNGPGVSNEPKEHQQTYQDMEQEQAQVSQPPAAKKTPTHSLQRKTGI